MRRIPKEKLYKLLSKDLDKYEKSLVVSIIKAQRNYPQITPRMYTAFWNVYNSYYLDED